MRETIQKHRNKVKDFKIYKSSCQNTKQALEYLKKHKDCPYGRLEYGVALLHENRVDEAKGIFEGLLDSKNRCFALTNLIGIEFKNKNYEKCYEYLKMLRDNDEQYYDEGRFRYMLYYCMLELSIPVNIDYSNLDYMEKIIFAYDRDVVLNHIAYHKKDVYVFKNRLYDYDEKTSDEMFFADGINIDEIYDNMTKILDLDEVKELHDMAICSKIFFKYDNIGSNVRGKKNVLAVMVLTGTNKIISMYPLKNAEKDYLVAKKPVFDYNEMLEKVKEQKHYRQ